MSNLLFVNHIYGPKKPSTGKTIIIFHGWGSSVKNYNEFAKFRALRGFQVIVSKIIFHDSRNKLELHFGKKITQEYIRETIFSSIEEADCLFVELETPQNDVILLGFSMGGFITNGIYANVREIFRLININGSGSFLLSEKIFRVSDHRTSFPTEEMDKLTSYDPLGKNKGFSLILLMYGVQDNVVSIQGPENYYAYLTNKSKTENITFLKYKDINHTISDKMMKNLIQ